MIACIKCKSKFEIPEKSGEPRETLTCPHCQTRFRVKWKIEMEAEPEAPAEKMAVGTAESAKSAGLRILVAVDGEATQDVMMEVLSGEGHEVFLASNGQEALSILEKEHPGIAYLDVALPQVLGFEVCEIIKKSPRLKETKVVLVSAIYDKTRYKRAPSSLYGADDYIERHHIHDGLIPKLRKMLGIGDSPSPSPAAQPSASSVEIMDKESLSPRNGIREAEPSQKIQTAAAPPPVPVAELALPEAPPAVQQAPVEAPSPLSSLPMLEIGTELEVGEVEAPLQETTPVLSPEEAAKNEEAKRFARLIISDIALYNQKVIEEGIENGNVEELLKDEMAEAEKLFRERVSKEMREKTPYLQDALRDLVDRKRKMMKQGN